MCVWIGSDVNSVGGCDGSRLSACLGYKSIRYQIVCSVSMVGIHSMFMKYHGRVDGRTLVMVACSYGV